MYCPYGWPLIFNPSWKLGIITLVCSPSRGQNCYGDYFHVPIIYHIVTLPITKGPGQTDTLLSVRTFQGLRDHPPPPVARGKGQTSPRLKVNLHYTKGLKSSEASLIILASKLPPIYNVRFLLNIEHCFPHYLYNLFFDLKLFLPPTSSPVPVVQSSIFQWHQPGGRGCIPNTKKQRSFLQCSYIEPSLHKVMMHPCPLHSFTPPWPLAIPQHSALPLHSATQLPWAGHAGCWKWSLTSSGSEVLAVLAQSHHCSTSLVFSMPYRVSLPQMPHCCCCCCYYCNHLPRSSYMCHQIIQWSFYSPHGRLTWYICMLKFCQIPEKEGERSLGLYIIFVFH